MDNEERNALCDGMTYLFATFLKHIDYSDVTGLTEISAHLARIALASIEEDGYRIVKPD